MAMIQQPPEGAKGYLGPAAKGEFDFTKKQDGPSYANRTLNINKTAQELLDAADPPVRVLWVSCKNPLSQDFDRNKLEKAFKKMEMVVVVDQSLQPDCRTGRYRSAGNDPFRRMDGQCRLLALLDVHQ